MAGGRGRPSVSAMAHEARRGCRRFPEGALRPGDVLAAFFAAAIAQMLAAVVAGVAAAAGAGHEWLWLALHLALLGGVSQLVVGAAQFFAGAFLATNPPPRGLVRAELAVWNAGTLLVAVGVSRQLVWMSDAGAAVLLVGVALYAAALRHLRSRSLRRAPWATRWYLGGAAFVAVGIVAGALLARGSSPLPGSLLGAHLALNLGGWFGLAIVGTLHTFFPSLTGTGLGHPRLQGPAFAAWSGGVGALAAGAGLGVGALLTLGFAGLAAGALLLGANMAASLRAAPAPLGVTARVIAVGHGCLVAGTVLALAVSATEGPAAVFGERRPALAALLLAGWIGLTVLGSLAHLLGVLQRIRSLGTAPPARPRDRAVAPVAAVGVAVMAVGALTGAAPVRPLGAGLLGLAYAALAARVLVLGGRLVRSGLRL